MRRVLLTCLVSAFALTAAACASSNAVPRPFPGAPVAKAKPPVRVAPGGASASTPDDGVTTDEPDAPDALAAPVAPGAPSLTSHRYDGRAVADYALAFRGVPYRFGGADPGGFDCSGLVQYVFAQYGIFVPRVVEQQWELGDKIKPREIKPGDLLFFSTKGPGASHVAIALDSERFVHAPNSAGVVRVEALSSAYWGAHYLGARRIAKTAASN